MALNDVKGEILEDWYKVLLKEFCEALQNKFFVIFHWKSILEHLLEKNWQQKFLFSKVALSN